MNSLPDQFAALAQANVRAMQTLMQTTYGAATRLAALNAETVQAAFAGGLADAGALSSGKDMRSLAQPAIEKSMSYWKAAYAILADAQNELAAMVRAEAAALNASMGGSALAGMGFAPAGGNPMLDAFNLAMSAASTTLERVGTTAGQFAGMARGVASPAKGDAPSPSAPAQASAPKGPKAA
jgi:hypothetical protein